MRGWCSWTMVDCMGLSGLEFVGAVLLHVMPTLPRLCLYDLHGCSVGDWSIVI